MAEPTKVEPEVEPTGRIPQSWLSPDGTPAWVKPVEVTKVKPAPAASSPPPKPAAPKPSPEVVRRPAPAPKPVDTKPAAQALPGMAPKPAAPATPLDVRAREAAVRMVDWSDPSPLGRRAAEQEAAFREKQIAETARRMADPALEAERVRVTAEDMDRRMRVLRVAAGETHPGELEDEDERAMLATLDEARAQEELRRLRAQAPPAEGPVGSAAAEGVVAEHARRTGVSPEVYQAAARITGVPTRRIALASLGHEASAVTGGEPDWGRALPAEVTTTPAGARTQEEAWLERKSARGDPVAKKLLAERTGAGIDRLERETTSGAEEAALRERATEPGAAGLEARRELASRAARDVVGAETAFEEQPRTSFAQPFGTYIEDVPEAARPGDPGYEYALGVVRRMTDLIPPEDLYSLDDLYLNDLSGHQRWLVAVADRIERKLPLDAGGGKEGRRQLAINEAVGFLAARKVTGDLGVPVFLHLGTDDITLGDALKASVEVVGITRDTNQVIVRRESRLLHLFGMIDVAQSAATGALFGPAGLGLGMAEGGTVEREGRAHPAGAMMVDAATDSVWQALSEGAVEGIANRDVFLYPALRMGREQAVEAGEAWREGDYMEAAGHGAAVAALGVSGLAATILSPDALVASSHLVGMVGRARRVVTGAKEARAADRVLKGVEENHRFASVEIADMRRALAAGDIAGADAAGERARSLLNSAARSESLLRHPDSGLNQVARDLDTDDAAIFATVRADAPKGDAIHDAADPALARSLRADPSEDPSIGSLHPSIQRADFAIGPDASAEQLQVAVKKAYGFADKLERMLALRKRLAADPEAVLRVFRADVENVLRAPDSAARQALGLGDAAIDAAVAAARMPAGQLHTKALAALPESGRVLAGILRRIDGIVHRGGDPAEIGAWVNDAILRRKSLPAIAEDAADAPDVAAWKKAQRYRFIHDLVLPTGHHARNAPSIRNVDRAIGALAVANETRAASAILRRKALDVAWGTGIRFRRGKPGELPALTQRIQAHLEDRISRLGRTKPDLREGEQALDLLEAEARARGDMRTREELEDELHATGSVTFRPGGQALGAVPAPPHAFEQKAVLRRERIAALVRENPDGIHPEEMERFVNESRTAKELATRIAKASKRPGHRLIAQKIADSLPDDLPVRGSPLEMHRGVFYPREGPNGAIVLRTLDGRGNAPAGMDEVSVLHELTHAATWAALRAEKATPRVRAARVDIESLVVHVREALVDVAEGRGAWSEGARTLMRTYGETFRYYTTNGDELLAGAFSDPEFRELLKLIPYREGAAGQLRLWDRFVQSLCDLLGIPYGHQTALGAIVDRGTRLMEAGVRAEDVRAGLRADDVPAAPGLRGMQGEEAARGEPPLAPAFYSQLRRQIEAYPGERITRGQLPKFFSTLASRGVKAEEVEWTRVREFMEGRPATTKRELLDWLDENAVVVEEKVLGGVARQRLMDDVTRAQADLTEALIADLRRGGRDTSPAGISRARDQLDDGSLLDEPGFDRTFVAFERMNRASEALGDAGTAGRTQYYTYVLPGGTNYRELLFKRPVKGDTKAVAQEAIEWLYRKTGRDPEEEWAYEHDSDYIDLAVAHGWVPPRGISHGEVPYIAPHFSGNAENLLLHVRMNDRVGPDGERLLHVEEVQSDWHQAGRKHGYRGTEEEIARARKEADAAKKAFDAAAARLPHPRMTREELAGLDAELDALIVRLGREGDLPRADMERYEALSRQYASRADYEEAAAALPERAAYEAAAGRLKHLTNTPRAPFTETWHQLAMKRVLRMAAEEGYDGVTWTTGVQQVRRYEDATRQVVDEVRWVRVPSVENAQKEVVHAEEALRTAAEHARLTGTETPRSAYDAHARALNALNAAERAKSGDRIVQAYKNGRPVFERTVSSTGALEPVPGALEPVPGGSNHIADYLGKEMARKILSSTDAEGAIKGDDLTIGGEGMKSFYDRMLPEWVGSYVKKLGGGRVDQTQIRATRGRGDHPAPPTTETVHHVAITPEMRRALLHEGQPLFAPKRGQPRPPAAGPPAAGPSTPRAPSSRRDLPGAVRAALKRDTFTADDLSAMQESLDSERAMRAGAPLQPGIEAPREAIDEPDASRVLRQWAAMPGIQGLIAKAASALYLGGNAERAGLHLPPAVREMGKRGERLIHQGINDVVRLMGEVRIQSPGMLSSAVKRVRGQPVEAAKLDEESYDKVLGFLAGRNTVFRDGSSAPSSGYDMAGAVRERIATWFAGLTDAQRATLNRLPTPAELARQEKPTREEAEALAILFNQTAPKFVSRMPEILSFRLQRDVAKVEQDVAFARALLDFAGVLDNSPRAADSLEATRHFVDAVRTTYGETEAGRIIAALAAHGQMERALVGWVRGGLAFSKSEMELFAKHLGGEYVDARHLPRMRELAQRFGLDPHLVEEAGPLAGGSDLIYVPSHVRGKVDAAIMGVEDEKSVNALIDRLTRAAPWPTRWAGALLRFNKNRMILGNVFLRQRYFWANTIDHVDQMAIVTGGRIALGSGARIAMQNTILLPLLSRGIWLAQQTGRAVAPAAEGTARMLAADPATVRRIGEMLRDDRVFERWRKGLQNAGDAIGRFLSGSKYRVETNAVLEGAPGFVVLGGRVYTYADLRRLAVETGVFNTFPSSEIQASVSRILVDVHGRVAEVRGALDAARRRALDRLVLNPWEELTRLPRELATAWSERERMGAFVTLLEQGFDAGTAGTIVTKALFDYAGSMTPADRHIIASVMLPFWAYQKNANRLILDAIFSPRAAYRLGVLRRARQYGPHAFAMMMYDAVVEPYGIDIDYLPPEAQEQYWAIREAVEEHYGGYSRVPPEVRRAVAALLAGQTAWTEDGRLYSLNALLQDDAARAALMTAKGAVPEPDPAQRRTHVRSRSGFPVTFAMIEDLMEWLTQAEQAGHHPTLEVLLPDSTIHSAFRHASALAATLILSGRVLAGDEESSGQLLSWHLPLLDIADPYRAPLLGEALSAIAERPGPPVKVHPWIMGLVEDTTSMVGPQGRVPFTAELLAHPVTAAGMEAGARAMSFNTIRPGMLMTRKPAIYDPLNPPGMAPVTLPAYYMPGGMWRIRFENSPMGELNRILWEIQKLPIEQAAGMQGELTRWARIVLGFQVVENDPRRAAEAERPREVVELVNAPPAVQ